MRKSLFIFMSLFFATASVAETPFPVAAVVRAPSIMTSYSGVKSAFSCSPVMMSLFERSGIPRGDSVSVMAMIDGYVRARMRYEREAEDSWSNYAEDLLRGDRAYGDCDDFAMTAGSLAACAGVSRERMGLAFRSVKTRSTDPRKIDHVFLYYVKDDVTYAVADTSRRSFVAVGDKSRISLWRSANDIVRDPMRYALTRPLSRD